MIKKIKPVFFKQFFLNKHLFIISCLALIVISSINCNCGKPSDKQAYEEVLGTFSAEKAKQFFQKYPESPYVNQLVDDFFLICQSDNTGQCCRMILPEIPEKQSRFIEFKMMCDKKKIKNK